MVEFLTVDEAAKFLRTTPKYVYKLVYERRLPCFRPTDGRLLFDPTELEDFIRKGRRSTHDELAGRADALLNARGRA